MKKFQYDFFFYLNAYDYFNPGCEMSYELIMNEA